MDIPTTPVILTNNNEQPNSDTQPSKRRRKKSVVWEHFTVENVEPGVTKACCKQCKKSFAYITGSKLAGTSHLKRHIQQGICPALRHNNQLTPFTPGSNSGGSGSAAGPPKKRHRSSSGLASIPLDQERCNHEIAKMIIQHNYPLNMVEHSSFVDFVHTLQPQFNMSSFSAIQGECVAIYLREKQSLMDQIGGIPGGVSLTLDLWTSNLDLGYVLVTGQFIDADWNLHRRILNVVTVHSPDSDDSFNQAVTACLSDWPLKGKLFSVTLDCSSNVSALECLRSHLSVRNPLVLNGQLLKTQCFARVLSGLAQDALGAVSGTVKKIRDSVKYVKTSDAREDKFIEIKQQLQVPSTKNLCIDDVTKWDTTYHMLVAASELKEVFACLDTSDPDYKLTPLMEEWKQIEILCTYLKLLYEAANILTSPSYPTTNIFFHEAWKIQWELMHAVMSEDPFLRNLATPLQEKFESYWKNCCLGLAIAIVMDPRYKMKLVEFSFNKIFGEKAESLMRIVDEGIHELYLEYSALTLPMPDIPIETNDGIANSEMSQETPLVSNDGLSDFELYVHEISGSHTMKSELDQYLEESLLPRAGEFDILTWWKMNRMKYPILSRMAADVLSVPASTVAGDSVFDTEGGKMDSHHSSLQPVTLESIICAKDWLQYGSSDMPNAPLIIEY